MITYSLQHGTLYVGADPLSTLHTLIVFGVDPLRIWHLTIFLTTSGYKNPWSSYIVIPTDNSFHRVSYHINVNRSWLFVFTEVQIVHMTREDGSIFEINNILDPITLLGILKYWTYSSILWILFHIEVMNLTKLSQQFDKLHAARLGHAIIEQNIDLCLSSIVQFARSQLQYLQRGRAIYI